MILALPNCDHECPIHAEHRSAVIVANLAKWVIVAPFRNGSHISTLSMIQTLPRPLAKSCSA